MGREVEGEARALTGGGASFYVFSHLPPGLFSLTFFSLDYFSNFVSFLMYHIFPTATPKKEANIYIYIPADCCWTWMRPGVGSCPGSAVVLAPL